DVHILTDNKEYTNENPSSKNSKVVARPT
ncbi:MAG: hypothetical protein ACI8RD_014797, partial [Bacillariaceae sp.]